VIVVAVVLVQGLVAGVVILVATATRDLVLAPVLEVVDADLLHQHVVIIVMLLATLLVIVLKDLCATSAINPVTLLVSVLHLFLPLLLVVLAEVQGLIPVLAVVPVHCLAHLVALVPVLLVALALAVVLGLAQCLALAVVPVLAVDHVAGHILLLLNQQQLLQLVLLH